MANSARCAPSASDGCRWRNLETSSPDMTDYLLGARSATTTMRNNGEKTTLNGRRRLKCYGIKIMLTTKNSMSASGVWKIRIMAGNGYRLIQTNVERRWRAIGTIILLSVARPVIFGGLRL